MIKNADRLKRVQEITVLKSIGEIKGVVGRHLEADWWVVCAILSVDGRIHFRLRCFANLTVSDRRKTPDT
ncbi:MAG: hypothetical protein C4B59_00060 [Candidatus Methanogaster sp.]|uniref:Uncharacterized protein n=1 Tax=Candidatus Methanogaster sp. TaxID=3386292 RepID=A0AC61L6Q2_9EURY|nr:MAG: hypothetical protein C4B59_00060 [ANME-2 cluster archaeon]